MLDTTVEMPMIIVKLMKVQEGIKAGYLLNPIISCLWTLRMADCGPPAITPGQVIDQAMAVEPVVSNHMSITSPRCRGCVLK